MQNVDSIEPLFSQAEVGELGATLQTMIILILDDNEAQAWVIESVLRRAGFGHVDVLTDSRELFAKFAEQPPDLLLLDLKMPHLSGTEVIRALKQGLSTKAFFPILVLTADDRPDVKTEALRLGAKDFLTKPFDTVELILRVRNLLETRRFYLELQHQKEHLEQIVAQRTSECDLAHVEMLARLARVSEHRDDQLGEHVWRVATLSAMLARELNLAPAFVDLLLRAARLHDIGKVAIADGILLKPTRLTHEEFEIIKTHTVIGAQFLAGGGSPLMQMAERIALTHHEHWDGTGYPYGLLGDQISLEGRIVAVADVLDTMTHDRPYKKAQPLSEVMTELLLQRGKQFDPDIIDACSRLYERGELISPSHLKR